MEDKDLKKKLKAEFKLRERQSLESKMLLTKDQLSNLLDYLDGINCEHNLNNTKKYLATLHVDSDAVFKWLQECGGYCDCEVLANVENAYLDILERRIEK